MHSKGYLIPKLMGVGGRAKKKKARDKIGGVERRRRRGDRKGEGWEKKMKQPAAADRE